MTRSRTSLISAAAVAALVAGLTAGAPAASAPSAPEQASVAADDDFYEAPDELPDGNGDIVRQQPATFYLDPAKLIEVDADVRRIMYRTSDAHGEPVAVTGTVLVPEREWNGDGERPLVGYAAGTQGLGDQCAPSRQLAAGTEYEGLFIKKMLARGYAVALTDYEGLGTEGVHTYMARESQGQAVLDAVRAARNLGAVPADGPVALSGYSQGGGASAAAAELADDYAPDLGVDGAYAGAVPADLAAVGGHLDGGAYAGFGVYALNGLAAAYDIDLADYATPEGVELLTAAEQQCTSDTIPHYAFKQIKDYTKDGSTLAELLEQEPLRGIAAEQLIGDDRAPRMPVLVGHSRLDDVIPYSVGKELAERWRDQGGDVRFATSAAPTHVGGAVALFPRAFGFLEKTFAGA